MYGQSYGGFCALSYLSFAPAGLREVLITGGLAPLHGTADRVYKATFRRVSARNAEYFSWYPEDREKVNKIARHLRTAAEFLPGGERLTVERFQMVGAFLGGNTRVDALHHLLEDAFIPAPGGERLSDQFLEQVYGLVSRSANPLYALMHESIYGQGQATQWAAWRVLNDFPEFRPEAPQLLLTGEMVYPWYFEQDKTLAPWGMLRNTWQKRRTGPLSTIRRSWPRTRSRSPRRCTARTSTSTGTYRWRPPRPSVDSRSGRQQISTMTHCRRR
ncbi:proline iminopeptidase [Arthrobacter sp. Hiyo6]|nr:proline iminopeptidase [Arthrobacter sp. Hiyo6]